jgi:hypothetical protein
MPDGSIELLGDGPPAVDSRPGPVDLGSGKVGAWLVGAFGVAALVDMVGGFFLLLYAAVFRAWAWDERVATFVLYAGIGPAAAFFLNRLPEILRGLIQLAAELAKLRHGPEVRP